MVLQSVTRAVTRPMDRPLRRGWPPRFGKRITLVSRVSLFTSSHFEAPIPADSTAAISRVIDGAPGSNRSRIFLQRPWILPSLRPITVSHRFSARQGDFYVIVYGAILSFRRRRVCPKGWSDGFRKRDSHENDTRRFLEKKNISSADLTCWNIVA